MRVCLFTNFSALSKQILNELLLEANSSRLSGSSLPRPAIPGSLLLSCWILTSELLHIITFSMLNLPFLVSWMGPTLSRITAFWSGRPDTYYGPRYIWRYVRGLPGPPTRSLTNLKMRRGGHSTQPFRVPQWYRVNSTIRPLWKKNRHQKQVKWQ